MVLCREERVCSSGDRSTDTITGTRINQGSDVGTAGPVPDLCADSFRDKNSDTSSVDCLGCVSLTFRLPLGHEPIMPAIECTLVGQCGQTEATGDQNNQVLHPKRLV